MEARAWRKVVKVHKLLLKYLNILLLEGKLKQTFMRTDLQISDIIKAQNQLYGHS